MVRSSSVADGLRDQGRRTPDRMAVRDARGGSSFAEVDGLVGTLARHLLDAGAVATRGAGAVRPVPLLLRRDEASVVALHAAFRAGVACALIDPDLPRGVVAEMVARLGHPAFAVVGTADDAAVLPEGVTAIPVPECAHEPIPAQPVEMDAPAVVVFTSGSTGRPKAVVLGWSAFEETPAHYLATRASDLPAAHIGLTAPLHWVGGLRRVLALGAGASVALKSGPARDPGELLEWLAAERVTQFALGPALAAQLDGVWPRGRRLERVDLVILGGDIAVGAHVECVRRLVAPEAVVRFAYSATETAGANVLCRSYAPGDDVAAGPLPMGWEAAAGRARFDPVDADAPGGLCEVVARGAVALGYLDDPDLTEARFGVDADGVRWWRTGDLVRLDDDGLAWHAGRLDDTVKINGKLVAPAESELVLRQMPAVRHVAVVPQRGARRTRLVAHVQIDPDASITPDGLRAHCTERLAPHVVPAVFVRHDRLPTTSTGKADRAGLAAAPVRPWRTVPARRPATDLERWLLVEVRRILEFDDVGPDDDLVAIGLDSLAVVELCAAVADAGYDDVAPASVVAARSVAGLARALGVPPAPTGSASTVVAFHETGHRTPIVALPGGGGTAARYRLLGDALGADQPVLVVEPRGMHRPGRPDRTVGALAAYACAEVTAALGPDAPVVVMGYSASGPVAYEAARRMQSSGRAVHLVLLDAAPTLRTVWEPAPPTPTVRTARPAQLAGAVARSVGYRARHARAGLRRWREERFPGPVRFEVDRYQAFQRIMVRAGRAYTPVPSPALGATLLYVGDDRLVDAVRRSLPTVDVRRVGGDHGSMLEPPFVGGLAAAIADAVDGAFGAPGP